MLCFCLLVQNLFIQMSTRQNKTEWLRKWTQMRKLMWIGLSWDADIVQFDAFWNVVSTMCTTHCDTMIVYSKQFSPSFSIIFTISTTYFFLLKLLVLWKYIDIKSFVVHFKFKKKVSICIKYVSSRSILKSSFIPHLNCTCTNGFLLISILAWYEFSQTILEYSRLSVIMSIMCILLGNFYPIMKDTSW